jgi:hypothetical protein
MGVGNYREGAAVRGGHSRVRLAIAARWPVLAWRRISISATSSDGDACTNQAESFFSRLRRAEIGTHHHISGRYLSAYASEMAWREDNRRVSNGEQYLMAANAVLAHPLAANGRDIGRRILQTSAIT